MRACLELGIIWYHLLSIERKGLSSAFSLYKAFCFCITLAPLCRRLPIIDRCCCEASSSKLSRLWLSRSHIDLPESTFVGN